MTMLRSHLIASGKRQTALAKELRISRSYMSDLVNGARQPSLELAFLIEKVTRGGVPASSWVSDISQSSQKAS